MPGLAQPAQEGGSYRIEITGEPSYAVDLMPEVVAAAPGIRPTLDLPLVTGKGLYAGHLPSKH